MGLNSVVKRSSSKAPSRMSQGGANQHPTRPQSALEQRGHGGASGMTAGTSPPSGSARETFLNYFFGQNGPGPIAGSSVDRAGHHGGQGHSHGHGHSHMNSQSIGSTEPTHIVPVGRDVSGGESALSSGLMAGKRSIDGNNAAYDMKSLGRHIEAVSEIFFYRSPDMPYFL